MLSDIMLSVITLSVIMLIPIMLSVVATTVNYERNMFMAAAREVMEVGFLSIMYCLSIDWCLLKGTSNFSRL